MEIEQLDPFRGQDTRSRVGPQRRGTLSRQLKGFYSLLDIREVLELCRWFSLLIIHLQRLVSVMLGSCFFLDSCHDQFVVSYFHGSIHQTGFSLDGVIEWNQVEGHKRVQYRTGFMAEFKPFNVMT